MISRADALELLKIQGYDDQDKIEMVLIELGLEPDSEELPEDIVEKVEAVFKSVGDAAKRLTSGDEKPQSNAITVQETTAIAQAQLLAEDIRIPDDVLLVIAESIVIETIKQADAINKIGERVFVNRLKQKRGEFANKVADAIAQSSTDFDATFSEQTLNSIADTYVPPVNINGFLKEVSELTASENNVSTRQKEINDFLAAVKSRKG